MLGYTWAGVRTSDLKSTKRFFAEDLGLSLSYEGKGLVQFELPSGQSFEVFSRENRYHSLHDCPVLAFQVEDVRQAKTELAVKGIQFETHVEGAD